MSGCHEYYLGDSLYLLCIISKETWSWGPTFCDWEPGLSHHPSFRCWFQQLCQGSPRALRFHDLLDGFTELRKAVILSALLLYSEQRIQIKVSQKARYWWLTPVILATQEAEIRRIAVRSQQIVWETLAQKNLTTKNWAGGRWRPWVQALGPQKKKWAKGKGTWAKSKIKLARASGGIPVMCFWCFAMVGVGGRRGEGVGNGPERLPRANWPIPRESEWLIYQCTFWYTNQLIPTISFMGLRFSTIHLDNHPRTRY
jgi:hypothetical protein